MRAFDPLRTRYFVVTLMISGGVITPAGIGLYFMFPDWSLMYLANPEHLPGWIVLPILLLLYTLGAPATFLATVRLMKEPKRAPLRVAIGSLLTFLVATLLLGMDQLTTVAYYDAYHHDLGALSLWSSTLLLPLILCTAAVGGAVYFSLRHVKRHIARLEDLPRLRSAETEMPSPSLFSVPKPP